MFLRLPDGMSESRRTSQGTANLVPRVLGLFGQRVSARRERPGAHPLTKKSQGLWVRDWGTARLFRFSFPELRSFWPAPRIDLLAPQLWEREWIILVIRWYSIYTSASLITRVSFVALASSWYKNNCDARLRLSSTKVRFFSCACDSSWANLRSSSCSRCISKRCFASLSSFCAITLTWSSRNRWTCKRRIEIWSTLPPCYFFKFALLIAQTRKKFTVRHNKLQLINEMKILQWERNGKYTP